MHWKNAEIGRFITPSERAAGKTDRWMDTQKIMAKDSNATSAGNMSWQIFPNICGWHLTLNLDYKFQRLSFLLFSQSHFSRIKAILLHLQGEKKKISGFAEVEYFISSFKPYSILDSISKFSIMIASTIPTPWHWSLSSCLTFSLWPSPRSSWPSLPNLMSASHLPWG